MTDDDRPWEPPLAGSEVEHLLGALDRQRMTFRWKADGLDAAGLATRVGGSALTLGGLLKHLAFVEAYYSRTKVAGASPGEPWASADWDATPGWDLVSAADDDPATLYARWDEEVAAAREAYAVAIADGGLDQPVDANADGVHASLRRVLFDVLEEYARHTGHADLLREAVDGRTGEDPPPGWRPSS